MWTEYGEIVPHLDWIRRDFPAVGLNTEYLSADQNNSEYGLFLRSVDELLALNEIFNEKKNDDPLHDVIEGAVGDSI